MSASGAGRHTRPGTSLVGGLDAAAYNEEVKGPTVYGPMVCVCAVPDAHPRIDFGMCQRCHRCPLVNFRILQKETAA